MDNTKPGTILLYSITPEEFYQQLRTIIKQEMQQDQLLTKEGAMKMSGVSNATFLRAIKEGIIKPQLVKGRTKAMYLESEVLKIEKEKKEQQ
jgi:predicted DNA-binding transcriptional regulator AlpA